MDADLTIARLAATQHGVVTRTQLLTAGVRAHVVDHRLARGVLAPVHAGVYRLSGTPATWHQRIVAATLAAGHGAVASHRAAAFLHGLGGIEPRLEVSVTRARAPRPRGVTVHRLGSLTPGDTEERDGIARTRPPATILGLAAVLPIDALERALDDALVRGLVTCEQLDRRLETGGRQGRPGAALLGALLAARSGARRWTQSEFERRLLALLAAAGIARPVPQYELALPGGRRAFLDFAWPELRLAVEADSYRHHSSRVDWASDHTRNTLVISIGWRIIPVTWNDLTRRPDQVVATLVRARAA